MSNELRVLILAAGKGVRMKSDLPKVCQQLAGRSLVQWVVAAVRPLSPALIGVVVGHRAELVRQVLAGEEGLSFYEQRQQLGTGHAVQMALRQLPPAAARVLILPGDVPLVAAETLRSFLQQHRQAGGQLSFLSMKLADPQGYGRVWRDGQGRLLGIVEEKDASPEQRRIEEVNSGIYLVEEELLRQGIERLHHDNAQQEYYLTDLVAIGRSLGWRCQAFCLGQRRELQGVNTPQELAALEARLAEGHG